MYHTKFATIFSPKLWARQLQRCVPQLRVVLQAYRDLLFPSCTLDHQLKVDSVIRLLTEQLKQLAPFSNA